MLFGTLLGLPIDRCSKTCSVRTPVVDRALGSRRIVYEMKQRHLVLPTTNVDSSPECLHVVPARLEGLQLHHDGCCACIASPARTMRPSTLDYNEAVDSKPAELQAVRQAASCLDRRPTCNNATVVSDSHYEARAQASTEMNKLNDILEL